MQRLKRGLGWERLGISKLRLLYLKLSLSYVISLKSYPEKREGMLSFPHTTIVAREPMCQVTIACSVGEESTVAHTICGTHAVTRSEPAETTMASGGSGGDRLGHNDLGMLRRPKSRLICWIRLTGDWI